MAFFLVQLGPHRVLKGPILDRCLGHKNAKGFDKKFILENVAIYKPIGLDIPLYGGRRCVR